MSAPAPRPGLPAAYAVTRLVTPVLEPPGRRASSTAGLSGPMIRGRRPRLSPVRRGVGALRTRTTTYEGPSRNSMAFGSRCPGGRSSGARPHRPDHRIEADRDHRPTRESSQSVALAARSGSRSCPGPLGGGPGPFAVVFASSPGVQRRRCPDRGSTVRSTRVTHAARLGPAGRPRRRPRRLWLLVPGGQLRSVDAVHDQRAATRRVPGSRGPAADGVRGEITRQRRLRAELHAGRAGLARRSWHRRCPVRRCHLGLSADQPRSRSRCSRRTGSRRRR